MENKKVKQMMLDIGALDVPKIVSIYTENNIKSRISGEGLPFNMKGAAEMDKVVKRTYKRAEKRGWFKDYTV
tara:strand:+ start:100 stop:315 length:216 start_codon:yes stop_codon:yes gene_type:complete